MFLLHALCLRLPSLRTESQSYHALRCRSGVEKGMLCAERLRAVSLTVDCPPLKEADMGIRTSVPKSGVHGSNGNVFF